MLRLRTLGGLSIESGSEALGPAASQRKTLALLALLAAAGSRGLSRDRIVAYVWPESPGDKASHRLTQLLYLLRRDLQTEDLFLGTIELRLNLRVITSDLAEFTAALEGGDFRRAAEVYGGPFLDGFYLSDAPEFERWVEDERARLGQRWTSTVERLAHEAGHRGDIAAAAGCWRQLSQADPLNARYAVSYLEGLGALGDRAGSLRFFRSYEALLRAEFGAEPDPRVIEASERVHRAPPQTADAPSPPAPAIAVLPFANLTPDQDNEYFSDGMTDEIITALARIPGLRVASRTSTFALKGKDLDAREIAERLGVSVLLEGTVRKVGNRIRLSAQLINAVDGCQLWSQTYDRTMDDVFALQEALSQAIVEALPLSGVRPSSRSAKPTPVPEAFALYLRGRFVSRKRTVDGLTLAIEYFEQAVEVDSNYAVAHAGLAECWAMRGFPEFGDLAPIDAMPRAKAAALEALRLDPRLADAHTQLAIIHLLFDWDWQGAEEEFRRAIQLEPDNYFGHMWYALFLGIQGRSEESLRRIQYVETLESLSLQARLMVGRCYFWARRYEEAIEYFRGLLPAEPGHLSTINWLARTLSVAGRPDEAFDEWEKVAPAQRTPWMNAYAAIALATLGRRAEALTLCETVERTSNARQIGLFPYLMAPVYAQLGEDAAALDALETAMEERSTLLPFLLTDPNLDRLHRHPRFERLLQQIHFPDALSHERRSLVAPSR